MLLAFLRGTLPCPGPKAAHTHSFILASSSPTLNPFRLILTPAPQLQPYLPPFPASFEIYRAPTARENTHDTIYLPFISYPILVSISGSEGRSWSALEIEFESFQTRSLEAITIVLQNQISDTCFHKLRDVHTFPPHSHTFIFILYFKLLSIAHHSSHPQHQPQTPT